MTQTTDRPKTTRERFEEPGPTFDLSGYTLWVMWGKHGRTLMLRRGQDGREEVDWAATRTVYASLRKVDIPTPGDHGKPHEQKIEVSDLRDGETIHVVGSHSDIIATLRVSESRNKIKVLKGALDPFDLR